MTNEDQSTIDQIVERGLAYLRNNNVNVPFTPNQDAYYITLPGLLSFRFPGAPKFTGSYKFTRTIAEWDPKILVDNSPASDRMIRDAAAKIVQGHNARFPNPAAQPAREPSQP